MNEDQALIEYLRRSYTATDGLWFMVAEEAHDFEHALALDEQVWQILPKIQARKAREVLGITGNSVADLTACFSLKLKADGHEFHVEQLPDGTEFVITRCQWRELLRKSGREHLEKRISGVIWPAELAGWCREFGDEFEFEYLDDPGGSTSSPQAREEEYRIVFRRTT